MTPRLGIGRCLVLCAAACALQQTQAQQAPAQQSQSPVTSAAAGKPIAASVAPGGSSWLALTARQRQALAPLERDWASIDSARQAKWLEVALRFPAMAPAEQQRVQERMAEWARMSPAERGQARLSFQESKQFSPEQKQARWEAYQALPDDQRKALAERRQAGADKPGSAAGRSPAGAAQTPASASMLRPVAPTLVQAKPGATTTLMTTAVEPPAHHRPGQPKIAAKPGQVDRSTLLPQSGPQAAASAPRTP